MNKMKQVKPNKNGPYDQGYFKPINENKYASADKVIIYRSSLELKFCQLCDASAKITKWASEPFSLKYEHPFIMDPSNPRKKKICNYYPDYLIELVLNENNKKIYIVEIKPISLILNPKPISKFASKKQKENYLYKVKQIAVNQAKAKAAKVFCEQKGYEYMFITENFINKLSRI